MHDSVSRMHNFKNAQFTTPAYGKEVACHHTPKLLTCQLGPPVNEATVDLGGPRIALQTIDGARKMK